MNKEQKLEKIYSEIANKGLSFGCVIETKHNNHSEVIISNSSTAINQFGIIKTTSRLQGYKLDKNNSEIKKIKGHPVLIGDVLYYNKEFIGGNLSNIHLNNGKEFFIYHNDLEIRKLWKLLRLPIEEQSEECINYIYNLLEEGKK